MAEKYPLNLILDNANEGKMIEFQCRRTMGGIFIWLKK